MLGAGETTLLRMVAAYSMFDNGGRKINPTLIDRIQDRYGRTIYRHDQRECRGCSSEAWNDTQTEPTLVDRRERVLDPMTAYQITSMMEGVVQRGTATVVREVGKPIAGKTGTTNDEKDAWFIGFSPEIVVGVYIGYDKPRHLGRGGTGGQLAAPIVRDFLKVALADRPADSVPRAGRHQADPRQPAHRHARRAGRAASILEAFKPGTAPPDGYSVGRRHRRRRPPGRAAAIAAAGAAAAVRGPALFNRLAACTESSDADAAAAHRGSCAGTGQSLHPAIGHRFQRASPCAPKLKPSSKRSSSRSGC